MWQRLFWHLVLTCENGYRKCRLGACNWQHSHGVEEEAKERSLTSSRHPVCHFPPRAALCQMWLLSTRLLNIYWKVEVQTCEISQLIHSAPFFTLYGIACSTKEKLFKIMKMSCLYSERNSLVYLQQQNIDRVWCLGSNLITPCRYSIFTQKYLGSDEQT